jgi:excisionase family DNA binding protein
MECLIAVPEFCRIVGGLSRWTAYSWLSAGKLKGVKVGSRVMIPQSEIERIVEEGAKKHANKRAHRT